MPVPPRAVTSSAASSIVSGRPSGPPSVLVDRAVTYTVAPSSPSTLAIPRPAPLLAPVTTATVSFKRIVIPPPCRLTLTPFVRVACEEVHRYLACSKQLTGEHWRP